MVATDRKSGDDFDTAVAKRKLIKTGRTSESPDKLLTVLR
jgi:hypothetical protein